MSSTVNVGRPAIGPIAEVVVASHRVDADVAVCERHFGWAVDRVEGVSAGVAARWRSPAVSGARSIVVRPPAGAPGAGVRFVESGPPPANLRPLTTHGWAAIEILVADVDTLAGRLSSAGIEILGHPAAVGAGRARHRRRRPGRGVRAMQAVLPGGGPVYLTEIHTAPSGFGLPRIDRGVGGVFIVVVASPDLEHTRAFFETSFRLPRVTDHPLAVGVLNRAFGFPPRTSHRVSSLQLAGDAAIEIDQYPPAATARPVGAGELPPGMAVVEVHPAAPDVRPGPVDGPFGLRLAVVASRT